jgi:hypothetical protein
METPERTIQLGLSKAFINKDFRPGYSTSAWGDSFIPSTATPSQWIDHALNGHSWIPGYFQGRTRTNETFISAQVLTLDGDQNVSVARALDDPIVRQYAALVHSTFTSGKPDLERDPSGAPVMKSRIAFILSEPVEGAERWRVLERALMRMVDLPIDNASEKPAQPYHGSTNRIEQPYINLDAVLPIGLVAEFCYDEALEDYRRETAPKPVMVKLEGNRAERYAASTFDNALREITSAPAGEKNSTLYSRGKQLFGMALGGWPGITESRVQAALEAIANGWPNARKSISTIKSARKKAQPRPLELPASKAGQGKRRKASPPAAPIPTDSPALPADLVIDAPYVELPTDARPRAIALQSDVGTGKTTAAIRLAGATKGRVSIWTHREKLAENISKAAARAGVPIEHYKDISRADQRRAPKLASCINTVIQLVDGDGIPASELLMMDEFSQQLEHIYGADNDTLRGDEPIVAGQVLEDAIRRTPNILVMDAHLSDFAIEYLKANRAADDVLTVRNDHIGQRGNVYLYDKRSAAIRAGLELVARNEGTITFAYASAEQAVTLNTELSELFGSENVLLVTADNSAGERQSAFLSDPNAEIGKYRAVIYSPVIGTGYDITAPVRAVVGVMDGNHLTAYDARQMVGRCRAAREIHIWLPNGEGGREENPATIEREAIERRERSTYRLIQNGRVVSAELPDAQRSYCYWHGRVMARRNASMNRRRAHFVELCKGYTVEFIEGQGDKTLDSKLRAIRDARKEVLAGLVLTAPVVTADEFRKLRDSGKVTDTAAAGHLRGQIEDVIGQSITPELRDQLWTHHQRAALRAFTDLFDDPAELELIDAQEDKANIPLPRRQYRYTRRGVRLAFLNALVENGKPLEMTKADLETALAPIIGKYADDLRLYFDWRADRCKSTAAIARRVLDSVGLVLASAQRRVEGKLTRFYQLDAVSIAAMRQKGAQRLRMLKLLRQAERGVSKLPLSEGNTPYGTFKTATTPIHSPMPDAPMGRPSGGWVATSTPHLEAIL